MSHPLPARRRLAPLAAVLAALAPGGGVCLAEHPRPRPEHRLRLRLPRSVSVQTQGDRKAPSGWKEPRWGASTATLPSPWETLTQGLWTVPPHRHPGRLGPSLLRLPAGVRRPGPAGDLAGGRGPDPHLYFPPGACYDLWLDPSSPAPADLSAIRASFTLL